YYTWKQRKFSIGTFMFGFVILWIAMIIIGTFIRGPGWQWFWPGQVWDHNRLIYEVNRDLPIVVPNLSWPEQVWDHNRLIYEVNRDLPDLFGITSNFIDQPI